jgi:hypothetical protein
MQIALLFSWPNRAFQSDASEARGPGSSEISN